MNRRMHKKIMMLMFVLMLSSCVVSLAYAYDYKLAPSPSDTVLPNTPVTMMFTTDDKAVTTVTFVWYDPSNNVAFTDGPKTVSSGSASSTYSPTVAGDWLVEATANNGEGRMRGFAVQDLNVIPEIPVLGTFGIAAAMLMGFVYKVKRPLKR